VHRIGRTGRAGKQGLAISLASSRDSEKLSAIEQCTGVPLEPTSSASGGRARKASAAPVATLDAKMSTLRISGGRKDKLRPGDILGALTGEAGGLDAADVGKIEIHDHFSYVAVSKPKSHAAQQSLSAGRIKSRKFKVDLVK